jgi:hypothetical protein
MARKNKQLSKDRVLSEKDQKHFDTLRQQALAPLTGKTWRRTAVAAKPPPSSIRRTSLKHVQPRPVRTVGAVPPSKPDTWTGGTVDPPPQTKAERKVKDWAGGKTAKRSTKARRLAGTPVSNIAGSKRDAERVQALDQQRQKEVKTALIAEIGSRPKPATSVVVSRFKKVISDSASAADYDRTRAALATKQGRHTRKQAPPPETRAGKRSLNAVQPRPIRELQPAPPSKPDTWKGGTIKPPLLTEAERKAKDWAGGKKTKQAAKSKRSTYTPVTNIAGAKQEIEQIRELDRQRQKEVLQATIAEVKANPPPKRNTGATHPSRPPKAKRKVPKKKPGTGWEGKKSNDILDSRARLGGSAFSGKRSR